jgi:hypothetical protein
MCVDDFPLCVDENFSVWTAAIPDYLGLDGKHKGNPPAGQEKNFTVGFHL